MAVKRGDWNPPAQAETFPKQPTEYPNMESQTSRKIIVASSMAVVLGIGVVTFALSSHHRTPVAQIPQSPPVVASTPDVSAAIVPGVDAAAAVAPTPVVPAAVAPIPDAPAVAH
jgi:hypothetical protein